jgi:hypothetical protein
MKLKRDGVTLAFEEAGSGRPPCCSFTAGRATGHTSLRSSNTSVNSTELSV